MLEGKAIEAITLLLKQEVTAAIGCTEPIAVALAVAKSKELLGDIPDRIELKLSANILKNAMGVGIPGTGMAGLPIAIVMGALVGKSEYGLEVLKDISPESLEAGKLLIDTLPIEIHLKEDISEKLYIEVLSFKAQSKAHVIITREHKRFSHLAINDEIIFHLDDGELATPNNQKIELSFDIVCQYALESQNDKPPDHNCRA